ncbi:hypothetical protein [Sphingobacterium cellulitidis]|uniref:hypothetical protein n=1 Tax=Sphingobacterium cellulitidis TaxID=1768011 RepID=UPI000B943432|nr:hypothetical protein CHT99_09610 [Sphingobacterium cellulitidis]
MAKKFRLFEGEDLTHWQTRAGDYNVNVIKSIQGGDIDKAKNFPTSIPSPFARLDLFRAAFAAFENPEMPLDGDSNNHRIIGECLDLLELLYNYDNVKDRLKVVVWDKSVDLPKLEQSNSAGHQLLAKTLSLFLSQDNSAFHFDQFNRFYIFFWDGFILGGTSPKSLVFTTANSKEFAKISVEEDVLFSGNSKPLYLRNKDFIKYVNSLFQSNELLRKNMSEFYTYIRKNLEHIQRTDHSFFKELDALDANSINDFAEISHETIYLEVFSIPLRKIKKEDLIEKISNESEFLIHSNKPIQGPVPMVLIENGHLGHLNYLNNTTKWDVNQEVLSTKLRLEDRELPGKAIKYPYYTVDDFLASNIYELPYNINKNQFFDGNFVNETSKNSVGYLLPLTPKFFEFFSEIDLWSKNIAGLSMIEIIKRNSYVQVVLRIPINKGKNHIELIKRYVTDDANDKQGLIKSCEKYVSVYPFIKTNENPNYYIQIIDRDQSDSPDHLQLQVKYGTHLPKNTSLKSKYGKNGSFYNTVFQQVNHNFSTILLKQAEASEGNYLIPKWQESNQSGNKFTFALDFGTSNSHIEYSINGEAPRSLNFSAENNGYGFSFDVNKVIGKEEGEIIDFEFFPRAINQDFAVNFPVRTAIFDFGNFDPIDYKSILDYNIGFYYEKTPLMKFNDSKARTNLKWQNDGVSDFEQKAWVASFLEQLIIMCKTRVLLDGGNISLTNFVWTYPLSYGSYQINEISLQMETLVHKHFGTMVKIEPICESIAPFYSMTSEGKLLGNSSNILSLDIGGGTVDSVVYQNNEIRNISSMIFGANYLYGNGYIKSIKSNKFYELGEEFANTFPEQFSKFYPIKDEIVQREKIEDIIAFYYSLENQIELRGKQNVSFSKFLSDKHEIRLIYLFYLSSILYFNLISMKALQMDAPTKILFSGNGSKFLDQLDLNKKKLGIKEYANSLVRKIFNINVDKFNLEIFTHENPKELTAKGAISIIDHEQDLLEKFSIRNINKTFSTYLGDTSQTFVSIQKPMIYSELNNDNLNSIINQYKSFVDFFLNQNEVDVKDLFAIKIDFKKKFESVLLNENKAREFLEAGLGFRKRQVSENERISDPLFFYIIRGMLGQIMQNVFDKSK